jgi:inner membrane protein
MTGRTHDLIAFTALSAVVMYQPLHPVSLGTALIAFNANMVGGLMPDIDQPTAKLWGDIPAGSVFSRIFTPLLGGHRFISHSFFGIALFGFLMHWFLTLASKTVLVDMNIVWIAFMIGYISHLLADTITHEGVPWLFPLPTKFGIPPIKSLRMKTGGIIEKFIIFPGFIMINGFLYYTNYGKVLQFFHHYIK